MPPSSGLVRSRRIPGQSPGHASCGSESFCLLHVYPRHHMAPPNMAPAGAAAPQSRNLVGGEDCLSEASSAAQTVGTGAKAPGGPRPGAHGFGSFCRNKRTSACGAETPQNPPPRRAGPKPRKHLSLSVILDISNRGSRVVVFCIPTRAIPWRHLTWRLRARLRPSPEI